MAKAFSKTTGRQIIGTAETIPGCAYIDPESFTFGPDGRIVDFDYAGDTKVYWDGQETVKGANRWRTFIDSHHDEVCESDVTALDPAPSESEKAARLAAAAPELAAALEWIAEQFDATDQQPVAIRARAALARVTGS